MGTIKVDFIKAEYHFWKPTTFVKSVEKLNKLMLSNYETILITQVYQYDMIVKLK